ncbi:MAG TPA: hypothetical protein VNU68_06745 [Verrucomicrobiae bacterium]|nr:hypothetical protein [Verrucomicrobiae bacterium]
MSDSIPPTSAMPPLLPTANAGATTRPEIMPLGEDPADREAIAGPLAAVEALLRQPRRVVYWARQGSAGRLTGILFAIALVCSLLYGIVVGTFSLNAQLWAAPLKVAGGFFLSALICLPSLYIFACLSGARVRVSEVCGLIAGLLALMTILLVGFAPVAWIFSQSTQSLPAMGALHLMFWAIATYFGVRFLQHGFSHFGGRPAGLRVWSLIFVLVMIQMTTALRPLVGTADSFLPGEKKFFLSHWVEELQK